MLSKNETCNGVEILEIWGVSLKFTQVSIFQNVQRLWIFFTSSSVLFSLKMAKFFWKNSKKYPKFFSIVWFSSNDFSICCILQIENSYDIVWTFDESKEFINIFDASLDRCCLLCSSSSCNCCIHHLPYRTRFFLWRYAFRYFRNFQLHDRIPSWALRM